MKLFKHHGAISLLGLVAILGCGSVALSHAGHAKIQLETKPAKNQMFPFEAGSESPQSPVQFTAWVLGETGLPVSNARVHLQVFSPKSTPWLTTDFPIVEGTKLLDINVLAPKGRVQFQQMLPIRGTYQVDVVATPAIAGEFAPLQNSFALPVRENVAKYRNAAILTAILLVAGVAGGWLIGGQQTIHPGEIAPRRVQLLLSSAAVLAIAALLVVNLTNAEHGQGHSHSHSHSSASTDTITPAVQTSQGLKLELLGSGEAIVGKPALFSVSVQDATRGLAVDDVQVNIQTVSLEDGWTAFAYQGGLDESGQLTWQQQFFDGTPHRMTVEVSPLPESPRQFQPFQVTQDVEVEAVEPPLLVQLVTLFYFTLILLIGLAIGFKVRRSLKVTAPST
jgi:hypothetical protein